MVTGGVMNNQRGAVLVISLIMLMVLTVLGLTAMQTSILEEKMAGNFRDRHTAFEAAESALRGGESLVASLADTSSFNGTGGRLSSTDPEPDFTNPSTWNNSMVYSGTLTGVATPPRYIAQHIVHTNTTTTGKGINAITTSTEVDYFKITARGTGRTNKSKVILQSYYKLGEGRTAWQELPR